MQIQTAAADYSLKEELAHSVTHGIGALLSVIGLATLILHASKYGDVWHIVGSSIYGSTLIVLYTSSTLYHSVTLPDLKRFLRKLDHAAIFLLIAGTYTPFTLVNLRGGWGWTLFGMVWSIAIAGMIMELIVKQRYRRISIGLYLGLGWLVMIAIEPLLANLATGGLLLLLVGGCSTRSVSSSTSGRRSSITTRSGTCSCLRAVPAIFLPYSFMSSRAVLPGSTCAGPVVPIIPFAVPEGPPVCGRSAPG